MIRRVFIPLLVGSAIAAGLLVFATMTHAAITHHTVAQITDMADPTKALVGFMFLCVTALAGYIVKRQTASDEKMLLLFDEAMWESRGIRHAVNNLSTTLMAVKFEDIETMKSVAENIKNEPELNAHRERLAKERERLKMPPRGSRSPQGR